jgi:uncharacterized membrane protein
MPSDDFSMLDQITAFLPVNPPGHKKATLPNHAGITLKQGETMEAFVNLFKSRKFWAAIAGLVLVVIQALMPDFPLDAEQVTNVIFVLVAFILGTGLEDSARS